MLIVSKLPAFQDLLKVGGGFWGTVSVARKLSGFVAHNLSGLNWSLREVTDETDRDATEDPEDAI